MPNVQTTALPGANTNLTRTQQALLSPSEQVIASRDKHNGEKKSALQKIESHENFAE